MRGQFGIGQFLTRSLARLRPWLRREPKAETSSAGPASPILHGAHIPRRGRVDHIIIIDGTMSSLYPGQESNAALTYGLLSGAKPAARRRLYYAPGLQWQGWRHLLGLAEGRGINSQIRHAYGWLASQYRPGDRIYLFGYSRGAYAVRSLAGMIDRVGLLHQNAATVRNVQAIWRHYRRAPDSASARAFAGQYCHREVEIEMIGVWDTVKALGFRIPLFWLLSEQRYAFHNHTLGRSIRHGFQALAMDETRAVFEPVLWHTGPEKAAHIRQMWFRGAHGDIGGPIGAQAQSRPLANIALVWMLEQAEACGLTLPFGWRARFPCDVNAPMVGTWKGWGKLFLLRRRRVMGQDLSESIHPSVGQARMSRRIGWLARAAAKLRAQAKAAP